jgi:hypothetical protein
MKTWKPTAAGILSIITGAFSVWYRSGLIIRGQSGFGAVGIVLGLIAIAGGIFAIRRKAWGLALAGAACAIYPPHPWGYLIWTPALGILAVVFVTLSRNEFSDSVSKSP